jgi:hypothetical protein
MLILYDLQFSIKANAKMRKSQTNSADLIIVYSKLNISNVCVSNRNVIESLSYLVIIFTHKRSFLFRYKLKKILEPQEQ